MDRTCDIVIVCPFGCCWHDGLTLSFWFSRTLSSPLHSTRLPSNQSRSSFTSTLTRTSSSDRRNECEAFQTCQKSTVWITDTNTEETKGGEATAATTVTVTIANQTITRCNVTDTETEVSSTSNRDCSITICCATATIWYSRFEYSNHVLDYPTPKDTSLHRTRLILIYTYDTHICDTDIRFSSRSW